MKERISKNLYIAKFFAIISVVCAHCAGVSDSYSSANMFVSRLLNSFGCVGVGVFMFVSGYLFYVSKRDFKSFIVSKLKSIVIPWLFCGSAVYLYVTVRKGGLSIWGWMKWLLGVDTYLYYLTVLLCLYLLCYFLRKNTVACYLLLLLSVVSNVLTSLGAVDFISPYLNPFNFLFFFACGMLCGRSNIIERVFDVARKLAFCAWFAYFGILLTLSYFDIGVGYFEAFYIPMEILAITAILGLSDMINRHCPTWVINIGKVSFSIYLLHMPVAGLVANLFNRIDFFFLTLIRPVVVLAITYVVIQFLLQLLNKTALKNVVKALIGAR